MGFFPPWGPPQLRGFTHCIFCSLCFQGLHGYFCKFREHNINLQSFFGPEEHHKNDLTLLHYNTCLQKDGILSISVIKCHGRAVLLIILLNNGTHLKPFHSISQHSLVSLMSYLSARFCFFYQKIALNAYSGIK